MNYSQIRL